MESLDVLIQRYTQENEYEGESEQALLEDLADNDQYEVLKEASVGMRVELAYGQTETLDDIQLPVAFDDPTYVRDLVITNISDQGVITMSNDFREIELAGPGFTPNKAQRNLRITPRNKSGRGKSYLGTSFNLKLS